MALWDHETHTQQLGFHFQALGFIHSEIVRIAHNQNIDTNPYTLIYSPPNNYSPAGTLTKHISPTNDYHLLHKWHPLQTCLNVKLMRGFWYFWAVSLGTACIHCTCVSSFITNKHPDDSRNSLFPKIPSFLWFRWRSKNLLGPPNDTEPTTFVHFARASVSPWNPIESFPSR